jgi:hypothetical protein
MAIGSALLLSPGVDLAHHATTPALPVANNTSHVAPRTKTDPHARVSDA